VVGGHRGVPGFEADRRGAEAGIGQRPADHRDVRTAVAQTGGGVVRVHEQQRYAGTGARPRLLQAPGVPAQRRPGVADPDLGGRTVDDLLQVTDLGQDPARLIDDLGADGRDRYVPGGAFQDAGAECGLQGRDRAGHRRLGDAEQCRRVGEGAGVHHGDQRAELAQLHIHTPSV
jgi:hypothetical protein